MKIRTQPVQPPPSVQPPTPAVRPAVAGSTQATPPPIPKDSFHFSLGGRTNGLPAAQIRFADPPTPKSAFGHAVHVDQPNPQDKKFLGLVNMTSSQEDQLKAAEARAFERFRHAANNPTRGSLQAKLNQASTQHYQPGYLEHGGHLHITAAESKEVMKALSRYGEEAASISITGRDRKGLQRFVEDRFFVTLFDRDKEEFEDYFKNGARDFFSDHFSQNNLDTQKPVQASSQDGLLALPDEKPESEYKVRYLRPRLGVDVRGLDYEQVKLKPKIDLVRLQGPALTELRLEADLPYKLNGEFTPEAHLSARRIFNHKPGEYGGLKDNLFVEGRTSYHVTENRLRTTIGLNKQISPDESLGMYALYSQSFEGQRSEDAGLGINYQKRWD